MRKSLQALDDVKCGRLFFNCEGVQRKSYRCCGHGNAGIKAIASLLNMTGCQVPYVRICASIGVDIVSKPTTMRSADRSSRPKGSSAVTDKSLLWSHLSRRLPVDRRFSSILWAESVRSKL